MTDPDINLRAPSQNPQEPQIPFGQNPLQVAQGKGVQAPGVQGKGTQGKGAQGKPKVKSLDPDYSSILRDSRRTFEAEKKADADRHLMQVFQSVARVDPSLAAEAKEKGVDLGIDSRWAESNIEKVREIWEAREYQAFIDTGGNKTLMQAMLEPDFARIARDDLKNLSLLDGWGASWTSASLQEDRALLQHKRSQQGGVLSSEDKAKVEEIDFKLTQLPVDSSGQGIVLGAVYGTSRMLGGAWRTMATSAGIGGAAWAATKYLPFLPTKFARHAGSLAGLGTLGTMTARREAGSYYDEMRRLGVSHEIAKAEADFAGYLSGGTEAGLFGLGAGRIAGVALKNYIASRAADAALSEKSKRKAIFDFAKGYLWSASGEIGTELTQVGWQKMAEDIAIAKTKDKTTLKLDQRGDVWEELGHTFWETLRGVSIMSSFGPALQLRNDLQKVDSSKFVEERLTNLDEVVSESKVRDRSLPALMDFLQQSIDSSDGPKTVSFDIDKFIEMMDESDISMKDLEERAPEVAAELRAAEANGTGEFEMPTASFGAKFLATDFGRSLIPHARAEAGGMTAAEGVRFEESKEALSEEALELLNDAERATVEFREEVQAVKKGMYQSLVDAGNSPREAAVESQLYSHFVAVMAEREGKTPQEFHQERLLKIISEQAAERTVDGEPSDDPAVVDALDAPAKRVAELQAAAQELAEGKLTREEYEEIVNKFKPVTPYETVPEPASDQEIEGALQSNKVEQMGGARDLPEGEPVALRLDIPAYNQHGVWVVSIHRSKKATSGTPGKVAGYDSVARVKNANMAIGQPGALKIAAGKKKAPLGVINGEWVPTTPEEAKAAMDAALNDPEWRQVGMDPERHAYFYDRTTLEPIVSADEVIQIGPLVMARNAVTAPKDQFLFQPKEFPSGVGPKGPFWKGDWSHLPGVHDLVTHEDKIAFAKEHGIRVLQSAEGWLWFEWPDGRISDALTEERTDVSTNPGEGQLLKFMADSQRPGFVTDKAIFVDLAPHQMTRAEFLLNRLGELGSAQDVRDIVAEYGEVWGPEGPKNKRQLDDLLARYEADPESFEGSVLAEHKEAIKFALSQGEVVPDRVMKDYPDQWSLDQLDFEQPADATFNEADFRPEVVSWAKEQFGDRVAPNGRAAAENFVAWFGDSKAVDEKGAPLVVYHGTSQDFTEFTGDRGFYFTADPGYASEYTQRDPSGWKSYAPPPLPHQPSRLRAQVVPAYISLSSPRIVLMKDAPTLSAVDIAEMRKAGYDGIIVAPQATSEQLAGESPLTPDLMEEVIAFDPTQIKSTENLGDFAPEQPDILEQPATAPLQFFSALARGIAGHDTKVATASGWKQALKSLLKKGEVKKDEIFWTGLEEWLDLQEGKITEKQIAKYLEGSGVKVEVVELVSMKEQEARLNRMIERRAILERSNEHELDAVIEAEDKFRQLLISDGASIANAEAILADARQVENIGDIDYLGVERSQQTMNAVAKLMRLRDEGRRERRDAWGVSMGSGLPADDTPFMAEWRELNQSIREARMEVIRRPKFADYTLPDGENYREVLVSLPTRVAPTPRPDLTIEKEFVAPNGSSHFRWSLPDGTSGKHIVERSEDPNPTVETVRHNIEIKLDIDAVHRVGQDFTGGHFGQIAPNVVVHLRVNDRIDADGNRVLFIEEIQSDWGQEGRDKGFAQPLTPKEIVRLRELRQRDDTGRYHVRQSVPNYGQTEGDWYIVDEKGIWHEETWRSKDEALEGLKRLNDSKDQRLTDTEYQEMWDLGERDEKVSLSRSPQGPFVSTEQTASLRVVKEKQEITDKKTGKTLTDKKTGEPQTRSVPVAYEVYYGKDKKGDPVLQKTFEDKASASAEVARLDALKKPIENTKSWLNLALKQVMMMAVEGNYDQVAFVTGEQSAARYDLSKKVESIDVTPNRIMAVESKEVNINLINGDDLTFYVTPDGTVAEVVDSSISDWEGKPLAEVVGKEVAEKIMAAEGEATLKGEDLTVGGEGMIDFYDNIIPQTLKKLVKKVGGKMETVDYGPTLREADPPMIEGEWDSVRNEIIDRQERSIKMRETATAYRRDHEELTSRQQELLDDHERQLEENEQELAELRLRRAHLARTLKSEDPTTEISNQPTLKITDEMRESVQAEGGAPLFAPGDRGPRGRYIPSQMTAILSENADPSTVMHEMMHHFTNVMLQIASEGNASQATLDDVDVMMRWWKIEGATPEERLAKWNSMSFKEQAPHHEALTYNYELWLFNGTAPTVGLRRLFEKVRTFMVGVYTSLVDAERKLSGTYKANFGADLPGMSPELREMFGRMVAGEETMRRAESVREMGPIFQTKDQFIDAGHDETQWEEYQRKIEDARQQMITDLNVASLRAMGWKKRARIRELAAIVAENKEKREATEKEVRREVEREAVYRILAFFKENKTGLDRDTVLAMLGGLDPKTIADIKEKLRGILKSPKKIPKEKPSEKDAADRRRSQALKKWQAKQRANHPDTYRTSVRTETIDGKKTSMTYDQVQMVVEHLEPAVERWEEIRTRPDKFESRGMTPDDVAEFFEGEFDTGEQLVDALIAASPIEEEIDVRTTVLLEERYGDLNNEQAMEDRVERAIHNEARSRFVAAELKFLEGSTKPARVMLAAAREAARKILLGRRLNDMDPHKFAQLEARAARAARDAMRTVKPRKAHTTKKGVEHKEVAGREPDPAAAIEAKQRQLLYNQLTKLSLEIKEEVRKAREKLFVKVSKGSDKDLAKTRNVNLVHVARAVLAQYGLLPEGAMVETVDFIKRMKTYSPELYHQYEDVLADAQEAGTQANFDYRNMTFEDFRVLREMIESLWYYSSRENEMEIAGKREKIAEIVAALKEQALDARRRKVIPGQDSATGDKHKVKTFLMRTRAALTKLHHYLHELDGGKQGPFTKYLYREVKEAINAYRADAAIHTKKYVDLLEKLRDQTDENGNSLLSESAIEFHDEDGTLIYTFGGKESNAGGMIELLGALLHMGNESNRSKFLVAGRGGNKTPWVDIITNQDGSLREIKYDKWEAFQARMVAEGRLRKEHFKFVQDVWNLMEEMKPTLQKAHMKMHGYAFKEVAPRAFEISFPDGTTELYRGGYVPAGVDHDRAREINVGGPPELTHDQLAQEHREGLPKLTGPMTMRRAENYRKRPLTMDLSAIAAHIDKALRYAHVAPAVEDMGRLIKDEGFRAAMSGVDPHAIDDIFIPFLDRAVTQSLYDNSRTGQTFSAAGQFWKYFRRISGVKIMAGNFVVGFQQFTGLANAMLYVKPRYMKDALVTLIRNGRGLTDMVTDLSTFMNDRLKNQNFELTEDLREIVLHRKGGKQLQSTVIKYAYILQGTTQNMVDTITWKAAFDQAMETVKPGENLFEHERRAIREADAAVIHSQGSFSPEDVAGYEKGTPHMRAWTQFTSYFNTVLNQVYYAQKGDRAKAAIIGFAIPMIVAEAIAMTLYDRWDDEDEDGHIDGAAFRDLFIWSQVRGGAAMVPGFGSFAVNMVDMAFGDRPYGDRVAAAPANSALSRAVLGTLIAISDTWKDGKDFKSGNVRDIFSLMALAYPYGGAALAPIIRPASYSAGMALGEHTPTGPLDLARGLMTGYASEDSKR